MGVLESCFSQIRGRGLRVVLPETRDERIVAAARRLRDEGLAEPILPDPESSAKLDAYAALYCANRPGTSPAVARRLALKPLFHAGLMVRAGDADAMVAGVAHPTARVIEAGMMTIGLAPGIETPSSFFLVVLAGRVLVYADCAVNADPTAEELADIALASAESCRRAAARRAPRCAALVFHQGQRAPPARGQGPACARNRESALADARDRRRAAGRHGARSRRWPPRSSATSARSRDARTCSSFPISTPGNIAYKLTQYLGGAQAIGPVLQGFARPLSDLSRGASVDDIVATAALVLALSEAGSAG